MALFVDPSLTADFAVCPYNENHVMKRNRMPSHLIKCAKNNAHIELMICPYNRQHRVCSSQYQKHIEKCAEYAQLSMREDVDSNAAAAERSVDIVETVANQNICEWDDSDITGFTVAASANEDVTDQLNLDKISFSQPVLTHKEGGSLDTDGRNDEKEDESAIKPTPFGIGRGKNCKFFNSSTDRRFGTKGVGRAKPKFDNSRYFDVE